MCRDNSRYYDLQQIYSYYELSDNLTLEFEPLFHEVAGTDSLWPILIMVEGKRKVISALWGLIPYYAKTRKDADLYRFKMVNARQETIFENNTYKDSIYKRRCIIPSTGFFEHHHEVGGKRKIPFFIRQKDSFILSLAGIYSTWVDKETGEVLTSYSIITTSANALMAKIHNGGDSPGRMPLMLEKDMIGKWLNPETNLAEIKEILSYKTATDRMQAHSVFTVRGKNKLSGEAIIDECQYADFTLDLGVT